MSEKCQKVFDEILTLVPTSRFNEIKKEGRGWIRFPIYVHRGLDEMDLEVLDLSIRSSNCLHRAGYRSIGELVAAISGVEDLMRIRNCGRKSAEEILEKLFCFQYEQLDSQRKIKYIYRVLEMNQDR